MFKVIEWAYNYITRAGGRFGIVRLSLSGNSNVFDKIYRNHSC